MCVVVYLIAATQVQTNLASHFQDIGVDISLMHRSLGSDRIASSY